jgi:hypothetical protein
MMIIIIIIFCLVCFFLWLYDYILSSRRRLESYTLSKEADQVFQRFFPGNLFFFCVERISEFLDVTGGDAYT